MQFIRSDMQTSCLLKICFDWPGIGWRWIPALPHHPSGSVNGQLKGTNSPDVVVIQLVTEVLGAGPEALVPGIVFIALR